MKITANDLRSNPALLDQYIKWKDLDMTSLVLDIVRDQAKPKLPPVELLDKPNICSALHNQRCGSEWALERMLTLDDDNKRKVTTDLVPNYGADAILKENGIIKKPVEGKKK